MARAQVPARGRLADRLARGDRHRIPEPVLWAVAGIAILPLSGVALRVLAMTTPDPTGLLRVGEWLNHAFDLSWVRAEDRDVVLHVLLLPLAALLTAFVRLGLGVRVLGFRAILIAIGFQQVGLLPSLLLIASIALTVAFIRPLMRRVGLPLYARIATILCIVALTMTGGLVLGAAFDVPVLWSVAFFPVVILAMLAESIADTLARQSTAMAAWRTAATIGLAGTIALLSQLEGVRALMLACPELIVSQLAAIVLVAELLDWRLLEGFRPGTSSAAPTPEGLPVVVVRNRFSPSVIAHRGAPTPRRYRRPSLQPLVDALRATGHRVTVLEGDATLPERLRSILPRGGAGAIPGVVLNFAGGVQGRGRLAQVPALCEMLGVPYTGADPQALGRLADRAHLLAALRQAGVRTPAHPERSAGESRPAADSFPLLVRPRDDADRTGKRVANAAALEASIAAIERGGSPALVEAAPTGRRLAVIVLEQPHDGGAMPVALPPVERDPRPGRRYRAVTLPAALREQVDRATLAAFRALDCRDLARIDLIIVDGEDPIVCELRPVVLPDRGGAVQVAAAAAGLSLGALGEWLLQGALGRAGIATPPRETASSPPRIETARGMTGAA